MNRDLRQLLNLSNNIIETTQVNTRLNTPAIQIQRKSNQIRTPSAIPISKRTSINATCINWLCHFCHCNGASSVIVQVYGDADLLALRNTPVKQLNLACEGSGHCYFDYWEEVEYYLVRGCRLPCCSDGFADVKSRAQFVLLISGFWESFVSVRIRCVVLTVKSIILLPSYGTPTSGWW